MSCKSSDVLQAVPVSPLEWKNAIMRRRTFRTIHDGNLWLRLAQIIKVEEPVSLADLRRFCRDVPIADLDFTLREMVSARRVNVSRE
jgi:hypothetical protein